MWGFVLRRLLWGVLIVLAVSALVFLMFYVFPTGDPAALRAGRTASPEQVEEVRHALGLERPVYVQYGIYLWNLIVDLDLGHSYQYGVPVLELIAERLPVTLALVFGATVIWLGVGIPVGVRSAARPGSLFDRVTGFGSLALLSAPVFWLGYMSLILFSAGAGSVLPLFPGIGAYVQAGSLLEKAWALALPCVVLGLATAAIYARFTRAVMSEQLGSEYVTAAHSRGIPERDVLWNHAFRTGSAPILAMLGNDLSLALAGNVVLVETVFNVPGVGSLLTKSIERSDLPVTQGIVLIAAVFVVCVTIAMDVIHAWVDPRVRSRAGHGA